jgi:hypothetical protein
MKFKSIKSGLKTLVCEKKSVSMETNIMKKVGSWRLEVGS